MKKIIALIKAGVITQMDVIDYVHHLEWVEYMKNVQPDDMFEGEEKYNCTPNKPFGVTYGAAFSWDEDETEKSLQ